MLPRVLRTSPVGTALAEVFRIIRPAGRTEASVLLSHADESHGEKCERTYAVAGMFGTDEHCFNLRSFGRVARLISRNLSTTPTASVGMVSSPTGPTNSVSI